MTGTVHGLAPRSSDVDALCVTGANVMQVNKIGFEKRMTPVWNQDGE